MGRIQILRDLRLGEFDVLVGINLLREGLDLPEVSLVAILDADQEGFLRSSTSLIQTIGRAARNVSGKVLLYADRQTQAIRDAVDETNRRRSLQQAYNQQHGIQPESVRKAINDILDTLGDLSGAGTAQDRNQKARQLSAEDLQRNLTQLRTAMQQAARNLEFETAAALRDEVYEMERLLKDKLGDFAVGLAAEQSQPYRTRGSRGGVPKPGEVGYRTPRSKKRG